MLFDPEKADSPPKKINPIKFPGYKESNVSVKTLKKNKFIKNYFRQLFTQFIKVLLPFCKSKKTMQGFS